MHKIKFVVYYEKNTLTPLSCSVWKKNCSDGRIQKQTSFKK